MTTLYYAPGACSTASHIALEESGAAFEGKPLSFARAEQRTPEYLKINPRGRVPALVVEDGTIVENTAILTYVAQALSGGTLLPQQPAAMARAISLMAWFSNTVHPAFTHIGRPERFATDVATHANLKETGRANFHGFLQEIDGLLAGKSWMLGEQFSVVDGYALVFYGWGKRIDLPVADLKNYTAFKDRMLARPAVRRVLEREQSVLLAA